MKTKVVQHVTRIYIKHLICDSMTWQHDKQSLLHNQRHFWFLLVGAICTKSWVQHERSLCRTFAGFSGQVLTYILRKFHGNGNWGPTQAHIKLFGAGGCHSGPLNFDQLLNNVFYIFGHNSVNAHKQGLKDNQLWDFSFEKKIFLTLKNAGKVRIVGKLKKN